MRVWKRFSEANGSRGAVLIEMALLAPLLVLLLLGIVDFGRALTAQIALVEAAEAGAIYAAYNPAPIVDIQTRVIENTDAPVIFLTDVVVTCPDPGDVKVTVTHQMNMITPIISNFFGPSLTLTGEATTVILGPDSCVAS